MGLNKNSIFQGLYAVIGGSSSYYFRQYHGEAEWLLRGYGNDVALPFTLYFMTKDFYLCKGLSPAQWTGMIFIGASLSEVAQAYGFWPGTYDPYDFLAFAVGAGLSLGVDRLTFGKGKKLEEMVKEN